MSTTIEEALDDAEGSILNSENVDLWRQSDARVQAEEILAKILGREVEVDDLDRSLSRKEIRAFQRLVRRRVAGEPVALITGSTEFRGLKLQVTKGVFVPRNSSEFLAEKAILRLRGRRDPHAVDVACGTGPVALALAKEVPKARVWGLDIWPPALKIARRNAGLLGLANVTFFNSDLLSALAPGLRGTIDVFTIHPPYVARGDVKDLPVEVRGYEPIVSLTDDSDDGLGLVRRLSQEAPDWLTDGGWVLIEVSPDLARKVRGILVSSGYRDVRSQRDSLGATRVIGGRL